MTGAGFKPLNRNQMAWRVAQDIPEGAAVNLGVGLPNEVLKYTPEDREILFQAENGVIGMASLPDGAEPDWTLVNAGRQPIRLLAGGSYFSHADSFAMIRGGHLDICVLGAYEVSERGDLANWLLPGAPVAPAVGGAMDLAYGAKRLFIICEHNAKNGDPKILKDCTLPLTGKNCVDRVFTDLAVIDVTDGGMVVREMVEGLGFETLQARTGAALMLDPVCRVLTAPNIG